MGKKQTGLMNVKSSALPKSYSTLHPSPNLTLFPSPRDGQRRARGARPGDRQGRPNRHRGGSGPLPGQGCLGGRGIPPHLQLPPPIHSDSVLGVQRPPRGGALARGSPAEAGRTDSSAVRGYRSSENEAAKCKGTRTKRSVSDIS